MVCTTKVPKSKHRSRHIPFARVEYLSCQIAVQRHRMMRRHPKLGSVDVGWVGGASHCFSHIPGTQNRILRLEARPRARGVFVVIPEPHRMLLCFVCDVPCCVLIFFPNIMSTIVMCLPCGMFAGCALLRRSLYSSPTSTLRIPVPIFLPFPWIR